MSRKDYNALAWELARVRPEENGPGRVAWEACVFAVAEACAGGLFKREMFVDACRTWEGRIANGARVFA